MIKQKRGLLLILSSPSGAGKTTLSKALIQHFPNMGLSVSHTTRPPRPNEIHGKDYIFINQETFFKQRDAGFFLEHAHVFGQHYYGTPAQIVEDTLSVGNDLVFDVDWQGTQQIIEKMPQDVVSIFILPPSLGELEKRLHARAQDSLETIQKRMCHAQAEMSHWAEYDYVLVNSCFEKTLQDIIHIVSAERLKKIRQKDLSTFVKHISKSL